MRTVMKLAPTGISQCDRRRKRPAGTTCAPVRDTRRPRLQDCCDFTSRELVLSARAANPLTFSFATKSPTIAERPAPRGARSARRITRKRCIPRQGSALPLQCEREARSVIFGVSAGLFRRVKIETRAIATRAIVAPRTRSISHDHRILRKGNNFINKGS